MITMTKTTTEVTPEAISQMSGLDRFQIWARAVVAMDATVEQGLRGYDREGAMRAAVSDSGMMDAARIAVSIDDQDSHIGVLCQLNAEHNFARTVAEIAVLLYVRARYELCKRVRRGGLHYFDEAYPLIMLSLEVAVRHAGRAVQASDPTAFLTEFADCIYNGKTRALKLLQTL